MKELTLFFAAALLCNAIPHLTNGLSGHRFPTPFAKPRGIGRSSALINFLWGSANVIAGLVILLPLPAAGFSTPELIALLAGALSLGCFMSWHFAKVQD